MIRSTKHFLLILILVGLFISSLSPNGVEITTAAAASDIAAAQRPMNWHVTGPMGGDVRSLVIDPQDPQRLYFGTIDGQIYTSTNGGEGWSRIANFNRPGLYMDHLIVDPRSSQTIYAAAHRHKEPGGFFKTTDGGATWREAAELKGEALHSLTQSPSNPDILIVGTNRGIFRTTDAGETWKQLPTSATPGLINVESLAVDPRNPEVIYAGTWYLPYKTTDGGNSWNIIKTGMIDDSDVFAIEIDAQNPDHVIASACSGIYETKNAGANWRKVNGIPSQSRRTRAILQHPLKPQVIFAGTTEGFWLSANGGDDWRVTTSRQNFEINAIAVHPKNPDTVYIGTNNYGVMISRDGGKSFTPSNEGYSGRRAYSILPDRENPNRVYAATINTATGGGYFFVSDDGGETWQVSNRNMPNRLIAYSILQDMGDANIIYLGTNYGMYRSIDRGASWAPVTAPEPKKKTAKGKRRGTATTSTEPVPTPVAEAVVPKTSDETVKRAQEALKLAGYDVGVVDGQAGTRTIAAVRKFQAAKRLPLSGKLDAVTLTALGLDGAKLAMQAPPVLTDTINALTYTFPDDEGRVAILAATNSGLYRSYDLAQGWKLMSFGEGIDSRTLCVSTSAQTPKTVWAGTSTSGVLVSRDGGETWQGVAGIKSEAPINVIEQDPQRPTHIYVGTTQTFYLTHDGGERWMRRGGDLPLGSFTSIVINPQNTNEIFVGNAYEMGGLSISLNLREGGGVFRTTNAGITWQRLDPDLPSRRVWALALDANDPGKIFVGSHSAGVLVARRRGESTTASSAVTSFTK